MYILLFLFIIVLVGVIYFYQGHSQDANKVIQAISIGCLHRLQGVKRGDNVSNQEIQSFMTSGSNKLLIITSVLPQDFIYNDTTSLSAVALSSAVVNNKKDYIVLSIQDKKMIPVGSPTENLSDALVYIDSIAKKQFDTQQTNVFFIDEDIPCPTPTPSLPSQSQTKEPCCGKRY